MLSNKNIRIVGVPSDLGASRRGVDMGPSALRIANLGSKLKALGYQVEDIGNIPVAVRESLSPTDVKARFLSEIMGYTKDLRDRVYQALKDGRMPLVIGGDHSLAIGSLAGVTKFYAENKARIGVIWMDAHADINTPETSLSGNIHGMPLAHALGVGNRQLLDLCGRVPMVEPSRTVLIGIRDLDQGEKDTIRDLGVRAFTMRDIDEIGMRGVLQEAIRIATNGTAGFHLSFDVDCMDPSVAPGVGTPVRGGTTYREGHLAMEILHDSCKILSMDVAEVNPVLDVSNQTADLAVEIVLSAFGKRIL
ncbi:MAG: arginase [Bdellovibrionales bacterium]|nr:arginase [Bdellovibrionales bacterium]